MPKKPVKKPSKAKTTPKQEKPQDGALMTTAQLLEATQYTAAHISDMHGAGIIGKVGQGKWNAIETLGALLRRLREKQDEAGRESRSKKNDFEAKTAELDFIEAARECCTIEDAVQYWSDARIAIRQCIERNPTLSQQQKHALLEEISQLNPEPPKATKE